MCQPSKVKKSLGVKKFQNVPQFVGGGGISGAMWKMGHKVEIGNSVSTGSAGEKNLN